ncbi:MULTISPECIES: SsrA-binding protein SmpB [Levilactobacillus]|uniref:SsrA-binding protein n=2 Tax=Levilactobacillus TaxID=2767886 RepID=A0A4Z0JA08_9LACO|nr:MULTISPECIES: SsrA-binding protein SmpB [Levilactobacillus]MCH4124011.1 SsrA-binding protein SmpB [Levilactobacillus sp.]MCI1554153.1 SsrA-binding protein SmpB [Levilactobacillus sp.]MCI1599916.1 SsrA-binding protein SmpB [Levilactobacillus sp.]MCI1606563.1 SsrA-binding protein SmpB [Levilactobacillus sp.]TGD19597.1 SsrA-binding protein SmpB [Levilactobacillus suantsaiihabitans]
MAKKKTKKTPDNVLAQNRKARHDYAVTDTIEAGIVLTGTEIKSLRARRVNLQDGFAQVRNNEAWLMNVHISEYVQGNRFNHDPLRNRKLLLHKKEIRRLGQATMDKGVTLIPLRMYLKHGFAKVLIGVAHGKREYDKRETIKRREQDRQIARVMKRY